MPPFTGRGNLPHQGGKEGEGKYRGQGSVMFTGSLLPSPQKMPRKKPFEERSQERASQRVSAPVCLWSHVTIQVRNGRWRFQGKRGIFLCSKYVWMGEGGSNNWKQIILAGDP